MDATAEQEFRDFVVSRSAALIRSAQLLTGDKALAEDAVQAALVRVYGAWPRIRRRDLVEAYARRAVHREVLSWRRRRQSTEVVAPLPPDVAVLDAAASIAERDAVQRALLQLPLRQRAVIVLRYFDDLSEAQTADALAISPGAVKAHSHRALNRLRVLLEPAEERSP